MEKNYYYLPKEEFRRRLLFLKKNLDLVLSTSLSYPSTELMPALHGVYSYIWCKREEDLFKKVFSLSKEDYVDKLFDSMGLEPLPKGSKLLSSICEVDSVGDDNEIPF